jgi:pyrroline-5-carboxylate reductase
MTNPPNIAFLGAGNMATALVRGAITRGGYAPGHIAVSDVREEARDALARELGVRSFATNREACDFADVLVLAVKPQMLGHVLSEVGNHVSPRTLVISIAAGVSISRLSLLLNGHERIIRAMPNTPAMVGEGATALTRGPTPASKTSRSRSSCSRPRASWCAWKST